MTTVINGLLGGSVVGLVATLATELVDDSPTTAILAAAVDDSTLPRWLGFVLPAVYGSAAGGLLLVLELFVLGVLGVPPTAGEAFGVAVGWSAVLLVAVAGVRRVALGRLAAGDVAALAVFHLAYGVGLGLWIRLTWIT